MTRTRMAQVVSLACTHHIPCVILMRSCCVFDSPSPLASLCCVSSLLLTCLSFWHQVHLPRCGGQIPCALQLMGTLALLPSTTLSQVMSPTTTTSRRLLNHTSRNQNDLEHDDVTIGIALSSPLLSLSLSRRRFVVQSIVVCRS